MTATTLAAVPVADSPPSKVTVGADKYLLPFVRSTILLIFPLAKNALAVAPDPESLVIFTTGSFTYPSPPLTSLSSVTINPTLSNQFFQGYVCIAALSAWIFPFVIHVLTLIILLLSYTTGRSKSLTIVLESSILE